MASILVCDDERSICQMLEIDLRKEGYKVETVMTKDEARRKIDSAVFDVIVTDIRMPNTADGMEVLSHARSVSPDSAVVLMTALAELETAIQAIKAGAFEYIVKQPGRINSEIKVAIARALETVTLRQQNFALRRKRQIMRDVQVLKHLLRHPAENWRRNLSALVETYR